MKRVVVVTGLFALLTLGCAPSQKSRLERGGLISQPPSQCLPRRIVHIAEANPQRDPDHHKDMLKTLIREVVVPNTTILLGPNVVLDFSEVPDESLPLSFGACVTLTSSPIDSAYPTARTPHSLGPLLKFGPHRSDDEKVFLSIECIPNFTPNDNVRISGFRIHGPSFGQQSVDDIGIKIRRCLNVEISNMEIAGWGGQAIQVEDDPQPGPGQEQPSNQEGERIGRPDQVRIFGNYFHHNQHPREGIWESQALGYGVDVHHGAWASVYENVFDFNRHAIAAAGDTGGYDALRNLVLKGGGYHYAGFHTHQFDIHGSGENGFGGQAGTRFLYAGNAFQYLAGPAIKVRGRPHDGVTIQDNIFPHEGLEHDGGDDAIHVEDRDDLDVMKIGPNNVIDYDSYGRYGVCDFDGDGVDDLFLATGKTWWFSSFGEFQWTYLSANTQRLEEVRLGYFDDDGRCDVLAQSGSQWAIASGGTAPWRDIGAFGAPLTEVVFGRFDPQARDHRGGATKRTTHAFRRTSNGKWLVTSLAKPAWQQTQDSAAPLNKLRFGDFTGDGVTDVLAVQDGRWSISQSARGGWTCLNEFLSDDVNSLFIADLNNNNIDDLIRLERREVPLGDQVQKIFTWWVSDDGRTRWRKLKTYTWLHAAAVSAPPVFAFAGRFGAAPGGGVLLTDGNRKGQFFSEAEVAAGSPPDWTSLFSY